VGDDNSSIAQHPVLLNRTVPSVRMLFIRIEGTVGARSAQHHRPRE